MKTKNCIFVVLLLFVYASIYCNANGAQSKKLSLIRDIEIEQGISFLSRPLLRAANLDETSVNIYIVKDESLNAFVSGGQNIFINTGLIIKTDDYSQLVGVIAHEIAHISLGHLSRILSAKNKAKNEALIGAVVGGAAALLGSPQVGQAFIHGGQHVGYRNLLSFSRAQESSADFAALKYLNNSGYSAEGLLVFFEKLSGQELLMSTNQDPYVRTHPITNSRITNVKRHLESTKYSPPNATIQVKNVYSRIRAKILAFTKQPSETYSIYGKSNTQAYARYARAIANFRELKIDVAHSILDNLIEDYPSDPYFKELKAHICFKNGKITCSLTYYEKAIPLLSESHLVRADLAKVQIASGERGLLEKAIKNLKLALEKEYKSPFVWRQLAIALGKTGQMGEGSIALAEESLLLAKWNDAIRLAKRGKKLTSKGTTLWIRAEDIIAIAEQNKLRR